MNKKKKNSSNKEETLPSQKSALLDRPPKFPINKKSQEERTSLLELILDTLKVKSST